MLDLKITKTPALACDNPKFLPAYSNFIKGRFALKPRNLRNRFKTAP